MRSLHITNMEDLLPYQAQWDALAGDCPFRSWAWLTTWWKHYGAPHQLYVLLVFAGDPQPHCQSGSACKSDPQPAQLTAILPCYLESHFARGRVLRLLGDGEVCSDHLDLLAPAELLEPVTLALAHTLNDQRHDWDTTEFTAIAEDSPGILQLAANLEALGCDVGRSPNQSRWAIDLPADWEAFLAMQSKSHRKQLRQLQRRVLDDGATVWHLVQTPGELEMAWPILVDLHQRRRNSLGEPGCFASPAWADFHREVAEALLAQNRLRLSWLELAGQPVAAEYHFASGHTTFAYQGGVDPRRIDEEPGRLSMMRTFQHALREGHTSFDLLRGDEPYKAHWRAQPLPTHDLRIVSTRSAARWRSQACSTLQRAARLARQFTNLLS